MLVICLCTYWLSVYLTWKNVYLGFLPIFKLFFLYWSVCYLYILDIDSLLVIPFANIFSFSRLSFHFVDTLFCCEKDFKFNLVPFVYFLFLFHCLRRQLQKDIATICVKEYFMFSSRSCMVSGIKLTSLMHF